MKIICVTGAPGSDVNKVADIFFAAGVKEAQPLRQDVSFTMASWHEKVIAAAGGNTTLAGPVQQPGRFWEQFATNLFMANMQESQWGWADPRSVWLLDFWQQFEPNLHFVLVYTSPQQALAEALAAEREHGSDTATVMAAWAAHQKEILRFHHRNPTRTILVDAAECCTAPAALLDLCGTRWKLDLTPAPTAITLAAPSMATPLVGYLAEQMRQTQPELQALQQELEASLQTLLPEADNSIITPELFAAVEDYKQIRDAATRAESLALQIDNMAGKFTATEAKLKTAHAEARSESDQILLQMHQLQEEMENGYLRNKELEEIKAKKKRTIEDLTKTLVQSEATIATLKRELESAKTNKSAEKEKTAAVTALMAAKNDLDIVRQDLKSLKAEHDALKETHKKQLETAKANGVAEKANAFAALATAKNDLDSVRQDLKRLKAELDAAKETHRKELETVKTNRSAEKEKVDALAALATAKNDLDAARQEANRLRDEQKVLKEAHQENELLLVQLHQVQEELEHYFFEHKSAVQQNHELSRRWERMLERTPNFCDYASLELLEVDQTGVRASWLFTELNAAGRAYPKLRFDTFITDGIAGFALERGNKVPTSPEPFDTLSASEWLLLPTLCRVLDEALQEPTGNLAQLSHAHRVALSSALAGLKNVIDSMPATLRFDKVILKREQVNPDYEHLWLQLGNLSLGEKRWGDIDFRLSCANVRPGKFGAHPKLEFPGESGSALLESWFAESFDDFGDKLELRFALPDAMDMSVWEKLSQADKVTLTALVTALPLVLSGLDDGQARLSRSILEWQQLADALKSILAARTEISVPTPALAVVQTASASSQLGEASGIGTIHKGFI